MMNPFLKTTVFVFVLFVTGFVLLSEEACAQYDGATLNSAAVPKASATNTQNAPFAGDTTVFSVGSLRMDRVEHGDLFAFETGSGYDVARSEIADPANFGPGGVVDVQFKLLPSIYDITSANLSGVDIFWAALLDDSKTLSNSEQQALYDYVVAGGALVVIADVGPNFSIGPNSMAAPFSLAWDNTSWLDYSPVITDPAHAIISGPFGVVNTIGIASEGSIDVLGTYATEVASNTNGSSIAAIARGALGPNSGPVLFFSDVNSFCSNDTPWGPGIDLGDNRVLLRNVFAHLVEEDSYTLAVSPDPLVAGQQGSFTASNGDPTTNTYLAYSLAGTGSIYIPVFDVTLDIIKPRQAGPVQVSNAQGTTIWNLPIPAGAAGRNVWLQAVQYGNKTNVVATSIL